MWLKLLTVYFQTLGLEVYLRFDLNWDHIATVVDNKIHFRGAAVSRPIINAQALDGLELLEDILLCQRTLELLEQFVSIQQHILS